MSTLNDLAFYSTGIGSVPHNDVDSIIRFVSKAFKNIPFWPQMSRISRFEDMIIQVGEGLPGLVYNDEENRCYIDPTDENFFIELEEFLADYDSIVSEGKTEILDKYAITPKYASAFRPWVEQIKSLNPIAIKGQTIGPFTYATTLTDLNKKCAYYDDTLREVIEKFLTLKALWQLEQFKKVCPGKHYIISLDEPSMSQYGSSAFLTVQKKDIVASLNAVAEVIHQFGGISLAHCCGNTDWSIITSSKVKMLNFDAYNFSDSITLYPQDIKSFIDRGGLIAWGLIPTLDPNQIEEANLDKVVQLFEKTKQILCNKGVDEFKLLKQSIITPSCGCGIGSVTVEQAEKAMTLTSEAAKYMRGKYIE